MRLLLVLSAVTLAAPLFAASNPAETVPFDHWAYDAVRELVLRGVLPGSVLPPFADVPRDHWAHDAVERLHAAGILVGYPDGTFSGGASAQTGSARLDEAFQQLIDRGIIIDYPRPGGRVSEAEFRAAMDRMLQLPATLWVPAQAEVRPQGPAGPPR